MNRKLITAWVVFALVMLGVVSFMACRKTENVKGDVFGAGSLLVIIPTRTPTPIGPTPTPLPLKMTISVTKCGRGCAYGCRFSIDEQTKTSNQNHSRRTRQLH